MDNIKKIGTVILFTCATLNLFGQSEIIKFNEVYDLIEIKNFFKAKEVYYANKNTFPVEYQHFTEAILYNAFNQIDKSQKEIAVLSNNKMTIPDSLRLELEKIKKDNAIKSYDYKEAKNTIIFILKHYKNLLTDKEITDFENDLNLWTALQNIPHQKVNILQPTVLKMKKDIAGLNNLDVTVNKETSSFIFDTGANLSTTSQSVAERLKMKIIPVEIEVGSITDTKVVAQLAVCENFKLGNIVIQNIVFLVMPDAALAFPQINYQINGILGFPVIEALKEIQITQDGYFIVPKSESKFIGDPNMAFNELTPLIYLDEMHFTFDTGANTTLFYNLFYTENQDEIDRNYKLEKIDLGGAGGSVQFEGYLIEYTFNSLKKQVTLSNVQLLKEKIKETETVYGNIGQDLIKKFNTMTINFEQMYIKFE